MSRTVEELAAEELAEVVGRAGAEELRSAADTIRHCVRQLSGEQLWWRPWPEMNSIANLILHVCGNVRQWILAGVGGQPDQRNRPAEFAARNSATADELLALLSQTVDEAVRVLEHVPAAEWGTTRIIQSFEVTAARALWHSVTHFRGHTQEIIHLTRQQLRDKYQYRFVPQTAEQGAACAGAAPTSVRGSSAGL